MWRVGRGRVGLAVGRTAAVALSRLGLWCSALACVKMLAHAGKCLSPRNISCSSKTKRRSGRPSPSSSATAAITSSRPIRARRPSPASPISPSTSSSPICACPASTAPRSSRPPVERYPDIIAIVVTGYGTVKDAVEAIKRGAWDFVSKPFQIDELLHVLDAALAQRRLESENKYLRAQLEERYRFEGMVGKSPAMRRLFQLLETVAPTSSTILDHAARPARARKSSRAPSITTARAARIASSRSTAARFPRRCSRRSSSATCAARSPARSATARAGSSRRTRARSSSTKSGR